MNKWAALLCAAIFGMAFGGGTYGLNKVQYIPFEWKKVETRHFDIYYYAGGDSVAAYAARNLEVMHDSVAMGLGAVLQQRIPVILHNTHAQFEQTNVMRYPIPEAVGGFTEIFKNRIVIPFDGSYPALHHVLHHELVHAMTFDMVSDGGRGMATAAKLSRMPLWLSEGTAEFLSLGWDISGEGYVADAVTSGYAVNPANDFGGFFAYKGGQSFLYFVESVFGTGAVRDVYNEMRAGYPFPVAFKRVTRVDLEEAGEIWLRELRRIYWPELGKRTFGKNVARALTDHRRDQSFYNVGSALSPDGRHVAFFSDRGDREAVYIVDADSGKEVRTVLEGGHMGAHESFHSFQSALSWSPDGQRLALVSKQGGRDVIHLLDARKARVLEELHPDLEAISSPAFSPDGTKLVFAGQKQGEQDLYLWTIGKGSLQKLTSGKAAEDRPVFSPSGRYIAYESDAESQVKDSFQRSKKDVFLWDLVEGSNRRITNSRWSSGSPTFGPSDSLLVFVSNRTGIDNLYMTEVFGDSVWNLTNLLSGTSSPSWSRDGKRLAFTLFEQGGFDVYLLRDPLAKRIPDTLARSEFVRMAEDSTGKTTLWRPLALTNLASYDSTARPDTIGQNARDPYAKTTDADSVEPSWHIPPAEGFFPTVAQRLRPPNMAAPDSAAAKTDSSDVRDSVVSANTPRTPFRLPPVDTIAFPERRAFAADSSLAPKAYNPEWSLDQAVAMAGFSNIDGVGGQGALVFSDLMGEQQFTLWFYSGGGGFEDINLFAAYEYLPLRPDLGVSYLHSSSTGTERMTYSQYLQSHPPLIDAPVGDPDSIEGRVPYRDEITSIEAHAAYPFSIYSRVTLSSDIAWRTRNYQRYGSDAIYNRNSDSYDYDLEDDPEAVTQRLDTWGAAFSWSFDNAEWGWVGPVLGERLWAGAHIVPPNVLQKDYAYWNLETDLRKYFRFFKRYTLAMRFLGGMTEGFSGYRNPHEYLLGGDAWTLNWHFNDENYHATLEETSLAGWETPLRGFRYHDFKGTRMGLINAEWRFPFIEELRFGWPIPLGIRNVAGVLFTDVGGTWDNREVMENRGWGYGLGWRMNLGIFVLRYSKAWGIHRFSTVKPGERVYWSLGAEF